MVKYITLTLPQAPNLLNPTGYSTPGAVPCWIQQVRNSCNLLDSVLTHLYDVDLLICILKVEPGASPVFQELLTPLQPEERSSIPQGA